MVQSRAAVAQHRADLGRSCGVTLEWQSVDTSAQPGDLTRHECGLQCRGGRDLQELGARGAAAVVGQKQGYDAHQHSVAESAAEARLLSTGASRGSSPADGPGFRGISSRRA